MIQIGKMDFYNRKDLYNFVEKCCSDFGDVDIPVSSCIERHLFENCGYDSDDAFERSLDISEEYYNIIK